MGIVINSQMPEITGNHEILNEIEKAKQIEIVQQQSLILDNSLRKIEAQNQLSIQRKLLQQESNETKLVPERIRAINESLEGQYHPATEVYFNRQCFEYAGKKIEGVFPEFPNVFQMELKENEYELSDYRQFKLANGKLADEVQNNPELMSKFNHRQIDQIINGDIPDGYTWHHCEKPGVMQLVDERIHALTKHTGGRNIWGGGTEYR